MTKRMLIDASHPEETRVVVMDGNRLEEFDLETAHRRPLKGNIYLAKVVRVEPSLQAAFVEYGGNRHGFLAFGEIHPDYYQIPVADRQRLLEMQAEEARAEEEAEEEAARAAEAGEDDAAEPAAEELEDMVPPEAEAAGMPEPLPEAIEADDALPPPAIEGAEAAAPAAVLTEAGPPASEPLQAEPTEAEPAAAVEPVERGAPEATPESTATDRMPGAEAGAAEPGAAAEEPLASAQPAEPPATPEQEAAPAPETPPRSQPLAMAVDRVRGEAEGGELAEPPGSETSEGRIESVPAEDAPPPETIGGENGNGESEEDRRERRIPPRFLRQYKIQEVIKRRQIMLVQVVKEERGSKGAALTTYVSLAGRFSVLMPNSPRGGGVSRKITSAADRKRLREIIDELALPQGMSLIVRTAGAQRPKPEIKRDCEYLLRLWDSIRERTLASTAPALIYEEADLIKRSIRDVYGRDIEEIGVEGDEAYQQAREFMRMLMPSHVGKIRMHREPVPLFARYQVDQQLDAMHSPIVQLRSGGYIVINQTEALVAIDVNSGRATRDRHIEDTALRTNLEASDEIARQLRLRDLAGLIVIDFIDMESSKHDGMVERRLKEALKHDRARIQVGRISHFGLLEMSRQRLRPSLAEHAFISCPHCQGRGLVRSVESSALQVLRAIEEEGAKRRTAECLVHVATAVALYLLNRKRDRLMQIEERTGMAVMLQPDDTLVAPALRIERLRAAAPEAAQAAPAALRMDYAPEAEEPEAAEAEAEAEPAEAEAEEGGEAARRAEGENGDGKGRRRRRRRRRGGKREEGQTAQAAEGEAEGEGEEEGESEPDTGTEAEPDAEAGEEDEERDEEAAAESGEAGAEEEDEAAEAAAGGEAAAEAAKRRRRGRRGGRRRREESGAPAPAPQPQPPQHQPPEPVRRLGPTPADPFAGQIDDIFEAMEAAEAAAERAASAPRAPRPAPPPAAPVTEAEIEAEAVTGPAPEPVSPPVAPVAPPPEPVQAAQAEPAEAPAVPSVQAVEPPAAPAEPVVGPVIQPVPVETVIAERPKRAGWWRR